VTAGTIKQDIFNLPNLLTLFRIVLIPIVCLLIASGTPAAGIWAVAVFGLASVTDWIDGEVARRQNLVSLTGKFLDPLADKLLVMACLLMLVPLDRLPIWIVIVILGREITITALRGIAATEGMVMAAGEEGKMKTIFQMVGLTGLMTHYTYEVNFIFTTAQVNFHALGFWILMISVVFSLVSAIQYFRSFILAIDQVK
jgi:CDP-diacylglycerol---glycerol-3-phosphate 3-phosphatidyltransferase